MVALWMGYATLVTALLTAGAWVADGVLAALGRPRRWAWAAAVVGGLALPGWAASRSAAPTPTLASPVTYGLDAPAIASPAARRPNGAEPGMTTWHVTVAPRARAARAIDAVTRALGALDGAMLAAWLLASAAGLAYVARGAWLVRRGRRDWRPAMVAGERVWLTSDVGPALVGALRPRVVLPAWVVEGLDADALRLVLAHERAHAAAGDPLLLACALGALVAAPWNPALWVAARRLRLAAEADCDRRVLRTHPGARRYARLLVDVAERTLGAGHGRGARVLATALLDSPGLLERRIGWLLGGERATGTRRAWHGAGGAIGAATVTVLACAVPRPASVPRDPSATGAGVNVASVNVASVNVASVNVASATARRQHLYTVAAALYAGLDTGPRRAIDTTLARAHAQADSIVRVQQAALLRAQASTDSPVRTQQAQLMHLQALTDSVLRARQATLARAESTLDSVTRLRDAQFARPRTEPRYLWGTATPRPARGGASPDSLLDQLNAAGAVLARDPRAKARFDSALAALRRELARTGATTRRDDAVNVLPTSPSP